MRAPIVITIRPAPRRHDSTVLLFDAFLGDRKLCRSSAPFLASARILLAEGESPHTIFLCRHDTSDTIALRSTVGAAAALSISENEREVVRFRKFEKVDPARRATPAWAKP